jgi:hypothetical protein
MRFGLLALMTLACGSLGLLSSASAAEPAQDPAAQADTVQQKAKFNEIERGFSFRVPVGVMAYIGNVTTGAITKSYTPGLLIGAEFGYDISPIFDLGGFFYFSHVYGVNGSLASDPQRDLQSALGGLMARISFVATERFYFGLRAGVGYGYQTTSVEPLQHGLGVVAALTAEYFTRIRHFSIALDAGGLVYLPVGSGMGLSGGITVTPAVRYTF